MDVQLANNKVKAYLLPNDKEVTILGWVSLRKGEGNTTVALNELRLQYEKIIVRPVYAVSESYWLHMLSLGLVDKLINEDGREILPKPRSCATIFDLLRSSNKEDQHVKRKWSETQNDLLRKLA